MSDTPLVVDCATFETRLSDYLERVLSEPERAAMDAHRAACTECDALVSELATIVNEAHALPTLTPSRDLWAGIAERLDTPVTLLDARSIGSGSHVGWHLDSRARPARTISVRLFAAAAVLLVTVSSGATWMFMQRSPGASAAVPASSIASRVPTADSTTIRQRSAPDSTNVAVLTSSVPAPSSSRNASLRDANDAPRARNTSRSSASRDVVYEREIVAMRRIVDERLGDLDSSTVVEIERNLAIIDKAIDDSRRALNHDPRSRFLSTQLDEALESKLAVLRRVALL